MHPALLPRRYRHAPRPHAARYADFFALFGTFSDYVDFFLLQDIVDERTGAVHFLLPFEGFSGRAIPANVHGYQRYRDRSVEFVTARNARIDHWLTQQAAVTNS